MSYWSGRAGPCWWSYFHGEITAADWQAFLAFSRESYTRGTRGEVITTLPFAVSAPSALMRKQLGALIDETAADNRIHYHAFATDSRVTYAINTAVNWLTRKPYEERTFHDPLEAFAWLRSVNADVVPEALASDIRQTVPASALWARLT